MSDIETAALPLVVLGSGWLLREIIGAVVKLRGGQSPGNYITRDEFQAEMTLFRSTLEQLTVLTGRIEERVAALQRSKD